MSVVNGITFKDTPKSGQVVCKNGYWSARREVITPWTTSLQLMICLAGSITRQAGDKGLFVPASATKYPLAYQGQDQNSTIIPDLFPQLIRRERLMGVPAKELMGGPAGDQALITIEYGESHLTSIYESWEWGSDAFFTTPGKGMTWSSDHKAVNISVPVTVPWRMHSFTILGVTASDLKFLEEEEYGTNNEIPMNTIGTVNGQKVFIPRVGRSPYELNYEQGLFMGARLETEMAVAYNMLGNAEVVMGRQPVYKLSLAFKERGTYDSDGVAVTGGWNQGYRTSLATPAWEEFDTGIYKTSDFRWVGKFFSGRLGTKDPNE